MRIWWTPWLPSGGFHFLHKIWEKLRNSPFPALVKSSFPWLSKHVKFFILLVSRSGSYIYIQTGQSEMKGPTLRLIHWNKLAAFSWASKVIRDFFGFALPRSRATISANQMQDLNQPHPGHLRFPRASSRLLVFSLSSHWLIMILSFALIGRCDYFRFSIFATRLKTAIFEVRVYLLYS